MLDVFIFMLSYILLSITFGFYVYFYKEKTKTIKERNDTKAYIILDNMFEIVNIEKYPKSSLVFMIVVAIVFSGTFAMFIKENKEDENVV